MMASKPSAKTDASCYIGHPMPKKPTAKPAKSKPGPAAQTLKLEGDWQENIKKAMTKKKPAGGWPK